MWKTWSGNNSCSSCFTTHAYFFQMTNNVKNFFFFLIEEIQRFSAELPVVARRARWIFALNLKVIAWRSRCGRLKALKQTTVGVGPSPLALSLSRAGLAAVLCRLGACSLTTCSSHSSVFPSSMLLGGLDFVISTQRTKLRSVQLYQTEEKKICLPHC